MASVKKSFIDDSLRKSFKISSSLACVALINSCSSLTHLYHCSPGIFSYVSHSIAPVFDFGNRIASNRCIELPPTSAFCYR